LSDLVARANASVGLDVKRRYDAHGTLLRRSDQWPFLQRGVPAVWFFTGLHPDYHTPADGPERIDYAKLARVTRLIYETSWALAEQDGRPRFARPTSR
jgi:Zn-dependent M28 family amino/carboxypeptidase